MRRKTRKLNKGAGTKSQPSGRYANQYMFSIFSFMNFRDIAIMQQQSQENKEETTRTFNFLVLYIRHTSYIVHRTRTTVIIIIFFFEMNYLLFSIFFFHLGCIVVIGYEYTAYMYE